MLHTLRLVTAPINPPGKQSQERAPALGAPAPSWHMDDEVLAAASALRAGSPGGGAALVLGGGFCGLACAYELACRGIGVAVVDGAAPGEAPASSAAAGVLGPLTIKGRLMWQGDAALTAALRLIRAADADADADADAQCVTQCGILHAPHSAKHAEQLRRSADEHAHGLAGDADGLTLTIIAGAVGAAGLTRTITEGASGAAAGTLGEAAGGDAAVGGVLAGCRWLCAEEAQAVAPG